MVDGLAKDKKMIPTKVEADYVAMFYGAFGCVSIRCNWTIWQEIQVGKRALRVTACSKETGFLETKDVMS